MKLDLNIGDVILCGKFRNKPVEVAGFDKDENGQPVILTKKGKKVKILCVRIKKLMPKKIKESLTLQKIYENNILQKKFVLTKIINPKVQIIIIKQ